LARQSWPKAKGKAEGIAEGNVEGNAEGKAEGHVGSNDQKAKQICEIDPGLQLYSSKKTMHLYLLIPAAPAQRSAA